MRDVDAVMEALDFAGYWDLGTVRYVDATEALARIEAEVERLEAWRDLAIHLMIEKHRDLLDAIAKLDEGGGDD